MSDFDPNAFASQMDNYIKVADGNLSQEYQNELSTLNGLTDAQIQQFGGTTTQMNEIIAEVEKAKNQNLSQAQLTDNLKALGKSTYDLAQKVSKLVP